MTEDLRSLPLALQYMQAEVEEVNTKLGWRNPGQVRFAEYIALLHSELSEALEAYRVHGLDDATAVRTYPEDHRVAKPEGVGSELADVYIRLLDMCTEFGIDLYAEYRRKLEFNKTRPYRHGGKRL